MARESKMDQKCWNKKDAQDIPAQDNGAYFFKFTFIYIITQKYMNFNAYGY